MNTSSDLFTPFLQAAMQAPQESHQPLYRGLFNAFQQAIVKGQLLPGDKLPASRALSDSLKVSRNTVKQVYEMLLAEGYIETRHGAGSFVSAQFSLQEAAGQQPDSSRKFQVKPSGFPPRAGNSIRSDHSTIMALNNCYSLPYPRWISFPGNNGSARWPAPGGQ